MLNSFLIKMLASTIQLHITTPHNHQPNTQTVRSLNDQGKNNHPNTQRARAVVVPKPNSMPKSYRPNPPQHSAFHDTRSPKGTRSVLTNYSSSSGQDHNQPHPKAKSVMIRLLFHPRTTNHHPTECWTVPNAGRAMFNILRYVISP